MNLCLVGSTQIAWKLDDRAKDHFDRITDREYLVGYNPEEDLLDILGNRPEFADGQHDKSIISEVYLKTFNLDVWSKNGEDICELPPQTNNAGKEVFHGSIINFDRVPIRCHSRNILDFWLQTRQIKVPSTIKEIRDLVAIVWERLGTRLQPIAKELMKGKSGYCSPELLAIKEDCSSISYSKSDDLIATLKKSFKDFNDGEFTTLFGKRNGTRERVPC